MNIKWIIAGTCLIMLGISGIYFLGYNMLYIVGGVFAAAFVFAATICAISAAVIGAIILGAGINMK